MIIKSKEEFLQALKFCQVLAHKVDNGDGPDENNDVFVFKHNEELVEMFSHSDKWNTNMGGGTKQNISNGNWREATENEKDNINYLIKKFDFQEKIFSKKYNLFENINGEDRVFKPINRIDNKHKENNYKDIILVEKSIS
jgi:hypothetical protein